MININLLDFAGELFIEQYHDLKKEIKNGLVCENPVHELIRREFFLTHIGCSESDIAGIINEKHCGTAGIKRQFRF